MKTTIALIPAYEPSVLLLALIQELTEQNFQIVIVDDGSSQKAQAVFQQITFANVLTHPHNRGKGTALKTGLSYIAKAFPADSIIVTLDADGQHTVADAIHVCREAEKHPDKLILGGRALDKNVPLRSRLGNSITRMVFHAVTGVHVHDTQTGLRAFSTEMIPEMLKIEGERYEYEMNVLLSYAKEKAAILEVPIETIYLNNNESSHFHTMSDSYKIYKEIFKFTGASFISFLIDYGMFLFLSLITAGLGSAGLLISNIGARMVSASVNYTLNRTLVFGSKKNISQSIAQYILLAGTILAGNTLCLQLLTSLGLPALFAKVIVEVIFFFISWMIQRRVVFAEEIREVTK